MPSDVDYLLNFAQGDSARNFAQCQEAVVARLPLSTASATREPMAQKPPTAIRS
jgi:hypothetical protein